jgi:hypothetical protein
MAFPFVDVESEVVDESSSSSELLLSLEELLLSLEELEELSVSEDVEDVGSR